MLPYLIIGCFLFVLWALGANIKDDNVSNDNPYSGDPYWGDPHGY